MDEIFGENISVKQMEKKQITKKIKKSSGYDDEIHGRNGWTK